MPKIYVSYRNQTAAREVDPQLAALANYLEEVLVEGSVTMVMHEVEIPCVQAEVSDGDLWKAQLEKLMGVQVTDRQPTAEWPGREVRDTHM